MEITEMPLRVRAGSVVDGGRFAWLMRGERRVGLGWAGDGPHLSIVQYIRSGVLLLF